MTPQEAIVGINKRIAQIEAEKSELDKWGMNHDPEVESELAHLRRIKEALR